MEVVHQLRSAIVVVTAEITEIESDLRRNQSLVDKYGACATNAQRHLDRLLSTKHAQLADMQRQLKLLQDDIDSGERLVNSSVAFPQSFGGMNMSALNTANQSNKGTISASSMLLSLPKGRETIHVITSSPILANSIRASK
eukprot:TRINITY_DN17333_c0_g1_i1.p1 TRINITY_DN17333_c0_g1~~TRINITY_DN17333_c0_g1_i1.p1  ORF type:complete len:141 (+),score=33.42 TRINITY_DN17333_c0_g1_i1:72-494(+)